jgi:hypothetical protein
VTRNPGPWAQTADQAIDAGRRYEAARPEFERRDAELHRRERPISTESANRIRLADSRLHYRGDLRGLVEGQVLGPSTVRESYVVLATDYDPATDTTTAHCAYATPDEIAADPRGGPR